MTIEEAIEFLERHQVWARSESKRYAEAVGVVLDALKKERGDKRS